MLLSRYLKIYRHPDHPGYRLLYSTRTCSLTLLPEETYEDLQEGRIDENIKEELVALGMLVTEHAAEQRQVMGMITEINRLNPGISCSVILGMACNFACTYCYEGSMKSNLAMTGATGDQLITYLKSRLTEGKKNLTMDFYGGEPLLYTKRIKQLTGALRPMVEEQGGRFRFALVTNGSLLTRKCVEELLPYGLYGAKVTVDGPATVHDRLRPFKSGRGSFEIILNNIRECCDLVKIGFGGNYTQATYKKIPELLEHIGELGLGPDKLGLVQFFPVQQTNDIFSNPEFNSGCVSSTEPWLAEAEIFTREQVLQRGYRTPKIGPSPCMVDVVDSFTVHYDGGLYKCVALIGHDNYRIGDIWQGEEDYSQRYHLDHWRKEKKCRQCVYLPLCFGGCRYGEYQRSGSMATVDCQKAFLDATLETTLKQQIRYQPPCKPQNHGAR